MKKIIATLIIVSLLSVPSFAYASDTIVLTMAQKDALVRSGAVEQYVGKPWAEVEKDLGAQSNSNFILWSILIKVNIDAAKTLWDAIKVQNGITNKIPSAE